LKLEEIKNILIYVKRDALEAKSVVQELKQKWDAEKAEGHSTMDKGERVREKFKRAILIGKQARNKKLGGIETILILSIVVAMSAGFYFSKYLVC